MGIRVRAAIVVAALGCGKAKDEPEDAPKPTDTPWRLTLSYDKHPRAEYSVVSVAKYGEDKRWIELQIGPPGVIGCGQQPKLAAKADFLVTAVFRNQPPLKPGEVRDGNFVRVSILQDGWRTTQYTNLRAELVKVSDPLEGKLDVKVDGLQVIGDFKARMCPQEPPPWAKRKPTTKLSKERLIAVVKSATETATSDAVAVRSLERELGQPDATASWFGIEPAEGPEGPTCWRLRAVNAWNERAARTSIKFTVDQADGEKCWKE